MKFFLPRENPETLWQILSGAGLVQGEMPLDPARAHGDRSPWFVKLMLGAAAWLSAFFFLIFITSFMGPLLQNEWVRAILGIMACGSAALYFRKTPSSAFIDQILFILALLGQGLVLSVIWDSWRSTYEFPYLPWLLTALFEAAVLMAIPYLPSRFLSALAILASLYCAAFQGFPALFMALCLALLALVLHGQWRSPRLWPVVAQALALVPLIIVTEHSIFPMQGGIFAEFAESGGLETLGRIALIAVWLGLAASQLKQVAEKPLLPKNLCIALLTLLPVAGTLQMPNASYALAVFFLGFSQRDKLLEGIGIVELLWSIGHYYYALEDSLLSKSLTLSALGAVLLLFRAASRHYLPERNEGEKA
ncbi:MAG: DUF4401 domain-containing protein [Betaproteobacteria bacterium]|nr:DUF4401 domain-containing protein [Betaproteobacteria bacterium]